MEYPDRFFRWILKDVLSDHELDIEFRCRRPSEDKHAVKLRQFWCEDLEEARTIWPEIRELNESGWDIDFTVVPRLRETHGHGEHPLPQIPVVSCIWADLDVGSKTAYPTISDALNGLDAVKPLPNIIVESDTGLHVYWLLKRPRRIPLERFQGLLEAVTRLLHGDKVAARPKRLMRVPHTINWKFQAERKFAMGHFLSKRGHRLKGLETSWNVGKRSADTKNKPAQKEPENQQGAYADIFTEHVRTLRPIGDSFEALGHCPFHDDEKPSFCVNLRTGLWECKSSECNARGNALQFCARMNVQIPTTGFYVIENGHICAIRQTKDGPVTIPLSNFDARVTEEITLDDGVETTRAFVIEGSLDTGGKLPATRVPASSFAGLNWVTQNWGVQAIVNAGFSKRDQLREAIQRLSPTPKRRSIFTHTGWREVNGKQVFLTSNGAIGGEEVEVELATELQRYRLPADPDNPREAMRASLRLLEIAPLTITIPLWAAMFRAPLCAALPSDFSEWAEGQTGSFKSTLAALFLCHFGDFDSKSLPGSWESTANQLEHRAFTLKDLPFVVDDYSPKPQLGYRDMEAKAARLLRAQGNLSGRGRLRADVTERPAHPPRGIMISTGEQHPPGQSLIARTLLSRVERTMVDVPTLTQAQQESSRLSHAMAGYISWLAPWIRDSRPLLSQLFEQMRSQATGKGHLRIPEVLGHLYVGLFMGTWYAEVDRHDASCR